MKKLTRGAAGIAFGLLALAVMPREAQAGNGFCMQGIYSILCCTVGEDGRVKHCTTIDIQ